MLKVHWFELLWICCTANGTNGMCALPRAYRRQTICNVSEDESQRKHAWNRLIVDVLIRMLLSMIHQWNSGFSSSRTDVLHGTNEPQQTNNVRELHDERHQPTNNVRSTQYSILVITGVRFDSGLEMHGINSVPQSTTKPINRGSLHQSSVI